MKHYLLFYEKVPDYSARQVPLAAAHRAHLDVWIDRGLLLVGGNLEDPADGALLLFLASSAAPVEEFALADPYVTGGVVAHWRVRGWDTVAGPLARPA